MTKLYQIVCAFFVMQTISILPAASSQGDEGLGKITRFSACYKGDTYFLPNQENPLACIKTLRSSVFAPAPLLVSTRGSSRMFAKGLCVFMASSSNIDNLKKVDEHFLGHLFNAMVIPAEERQRKHDEKRDAMLESNRRLEELRLALKMRCPDSGELSDLEQTASSDVKMDKLKCNKKTVEQSIRLFQEEHAFKLLAERAKGKDTSANVFELATSILKEDDFVKCSLYWIPSGKRPKNFEFNFPYKERNKHSKPNECVGITELAQPSHHISGIDPSKICQTAIVELNSQISDYGIHVASERFVNTQFKETDVLSRYEKAFFVVFDFIRAYGEIDEADLRSSSSSSD